MSRDELRAILNDVKQEMFVKNEYEPLWISLKELEDILKKRKKGERKMWIDPFMCGVVATLLGEMILLIVYAVIKGSKKK